MAISSKTLIFFDAACLIAAAGSPTGGSAFLLAVCRRGFLRACSSQAVLIEAERNVRSKRPAADQEALRLIVTGPGLMLVSLPPSALVEHYQEEFVEDAHVIAAAIGAGANYLITLDRRLINRVERSTIELVASTPGDFIGHALVTHPDSRRSADLACQAS